MKPQNGTNSVKAGLVPFSRHKGTPNPALTQLCGLCHSDEFGQEEEFEEEDPFGHGFNIIQERVYVGNVTTHATVAAGSRSSVSRSVGGGGVSSSTLADPVADAAAPAPSPAPSRQPDMLGRASLPTIKYVSEGVGGRGLNRNRPSRGRVRSVPAGRCKSEGGGAVSQVGVGDPSSVSAASSSSSSSCPPRPVSFARSPLAVSMGSRADAFVRHATTSRYVQALGLSTQQIADARDQYANQQSTQFAQSTIRVTGCSSASCYFQISKPEAAEDEQQEHDDRWGDRPFF